MEMFCTKKIKVGSHLKAVKTSTSKDYDLLALNFDGMVFKDDVGWPKNINVHSSLNRMLLPYATSIFGIACVVGGISCTSALVFMAKPYEGTGEESSWNSLAASPLARSDTYPVSYAGYVFLKKYILGLHVTTSFSKIQN